MNYTEVSIPMKDAAMAEVIVAELAQIGYEGFEEREKLLAAYVPEEAFDKEALGDILSRYELDCNTRSIEEQNWNATWEESFSPVVIGDFCVIRADFHEQQHGYTHEVIITPKMSFGTGHHATTRLMVEQMRELDLKGKTVLDFGTGTGVLAILASKLGATDVLGIDNDEWSAENAIENIERNAVDGITIIGGSIEVAGVQQYDVILANINRHILLQYMKRMEELLKDNGIVIMSGILTEDEGTVVSEAAKAGLSKLNTTTHDNWMSIGFKKHIGA